ncbi:multidrug ABC transporter ATP-binding protein [Lentzea sp. NBRC 105346]|uniref:ABC transporter ATP-binding protein n=1 Tax=Lentzea sp. NBRC 105346 TaxID=3032205 RepID=UPI0024A34062|nr:ABC transporter ATP-binding protein [Lentzea sp. NBRC 105346]GLZ28544.1 multidrug ABC transporter ATP-binding protein [Lentzea sp. NBRC 105346]
MTQHDAVTVSALVKRYPRKPRPAVDGLGFTVRRGEVFGLLGPNGAGKTTTIGVLTTRVLPTSGTVTVEGVDVVTQPSAARALLAVVPQHNNLDRALTVRQNLLFHAKYHGVRRGERRRRADEILDLMGLAEHAGSTIMRLSGGQQQRVMIARALMHRPTVMFFDEPSNALDPQAKLFVYQRISELRDEGVTVVLTTHDMDEAARLCDRVGIIDHGRLLTLDTPAALTAAMEGDVTVKLTVEGADPGQLATKLSTVHGVQHVETLGAHDFRLRVDADSAPVLAAALRVVDEFGARLRDVATDRPSLEDVFIKLTGRDLR